MDKKQKAALAVFMRNYSEAAGLGHSEQRLAELEPEVITLFEDMKKLWSIPIDDVEPAIGFVAEDSDAVG